MDNVALIFHACVGHIGSIEDLLVRDSQTSESMCCVLEQDTETCIKQKQTDILPAAYYWIHPGRPIPTRSKDC